MNKTEIEELADCVAKIAAITDTQDVDIIEALNGLAWDEEDGFKVACTLVSRIPVKEE